MFLKDKTRRDFLANSARFAAGAGFLLNAGSWKKVLGANDRVRLGVIGTGNRVPTLLYNGYAEQVAGLYAGMKQDRALFF